MTDVAAVPDQRVATRVVHAMWGVLLAVLAGAPVVYTLTSRRPYSAGPAPLLGAPPPALTSAVTAALATLVVAVAFGLVVLALPVARLPRVGGRAVLGAIAFSGAIVVSAWWHGSSIGVGLLALPFVVVAIAAFPRPSLVWFERRLTAAMRLMVWGSAVAGVVAPSWALQRGSVASVLPGVSSRLAGLTPHPNALGPVAVALVVLEWRRRPRNVPAVLVALAALTWTQSKTSWAAMALLAGVALARVLRQRVPHRSALPLLAFAAVFGASAYVGLGLLGDTRATDRRDVSTETFTGRTAIWEVTLEVWQDDPVLGYGTALWDDAMDRRYAGRVGFPPGHAHNQLIQTLGQAGLVGALALVLYLLAFGNLVRRADAITGGAAGALFLVLIVRCFSEPPLQSVPYGTSFFLAVTTFAYAFVAANEDARG